MRFSVVDKEEGKSLVGVHNISKEKLRKALKLGGLANPSVAVIDARKFNHDGFGEISLITPPELIDSKTGRNAGTWLGDAWTPMFPDCVYEISKESYERMTKDLQSSSDEYIRDNAEWLGRSLFYPQDRDQIVYNELLAYMFLAKERGVNPKEIKCPDGTFINFDKDGNILPDPKPGKMTPESLTEYIRDNNLVDDYMHFIDRLREHYGVTSLLFEDDNEPVTLEGASRRMNNYRGDKDANGGSVYAAFTRNVGTLDEIRDEKHRLTGEDYDKILKEVGKKWNGFLTELAKDAGGGRLDRGLSSLYRAFHSGDAKSYLENYCRVKLTDEQKNKLDEFENFVANELPAEYFETKFNRPVYLNEFAGAVVPEGTDEDIVKALRDAGLRVETYEKGSLDDRKRAVNELAEAEDVRFSREDEPSFRSKEERKEARDYLTGDDYAAELTGDEFPKGEKSLMEQVTDFYKERYGGRVFRDGVGEVILDKQGVRSSIAHGLRGKKAVAFAAVPDIITKGRIIDAQEDWKDRGYGSTTIAAPIRIDKGRYIS